MVGGTIAMPLLLAPALCIEEDDPATSSIISTVVFVSGIVTMLQTTFGVRWFYFYSNKCRSKQVIT